MAIDYIDNIVQAELVPLVPLEKADLRKEA